MTASAIPRSTEQLLAEADALALRLAHSDLPLNEATIVMQLRARLAFTERLLELRDDLSRASDQRREGREVTRA